MSIHEREREREAKVRQERHSIVCARVLVSLKSSPYTNSTYPSASRHVDAALSTSTLVTRSQSGGRGRVISTAASLKAAWAAAAPKRTHPNRACPSVLIDLSILRRRALAVVSTTRMSCSGKPKQSHFRQLLSLSPVGWRRTNKRARGWPRLPTARRLK